MRTPIVDTNDGAQSEASVLSPKYVYVSPLPFQDRHFAQRMLDVKA
jgi:hypothetical protein